MEDAQHLVLLNSKDKARCHRRSRRQADCLTDEASLTKEVTRSEDCDDRFFVLFGFDLELHPAVLNIENSVGGITLREDSVVLGALRNRLGHAYRGEKRMGIEMNHSLLFLNRVR